jgi:hypothetical protein
MKDGISIDRERLYTVCEGLGFKLHNDDIVRVTGQFIYKYDYRSFVDEVKAYVKEEDADLYRDICNAWEVFIEKHGKFTVTRLQVLQTDNILKDDKNNCFKVYLNGILHINSDNINFGYTTDKLIWHHSVLQRGYRSGDSGVYVDYLNKAVQLEQNYDYVLSCLGYLSHEYKESESAYIIVLTEQCENPKDGGGAGKNVFCQLLRHTTTIHNKPGSQVKTDEKFMQSWDGQKIYCITDVLKSFSYDFLKSMTDDGGLQKKLFKNEVAISKEDMPKFLINTNYSVDVKDGGLKRRIRMLEFTDFFTKSKGIDVFYGKNFPGSWNECDWAGFDSCIALAIQLFLQNNRKIPEKQLSEGGWLKQWEQEYSTPATDFIKTNIESWIEMEFVPNEIFDTRLMDFKVKGGYKFMPPNKKIYEAIEKYCDKHRIIFQVSKLQRVDGKVDPVKGKLFIKH